VRLRRARAWLGVAFFVHCTLIVYVGCSVAGGSVGPPAAAVAASVLTAVPMAVLLWRERRSSTAGQPWRWPRSGLAVVPVHAVGVGIAAGDLLAPAGMTMWTAVPSIAAVVSVVELLPVVLAGRALRRPLSADLGELDVEIRVEIRSGARRWWLAQDDVRLTDEQLIITVRPGPRWGYVRTVDLADVRAVEVRPAREEDRPWFSTDDGHVVSPPHGDVVVVGHRRGVQILPVFEPVGFGEVLRARVERSVRVGDDQA
jgi:hypothetical protein